MGLGVLEDRHMAHVPGTTRYFDDVNERPQLADEQSARQLKCDNSGPQPIILVPQPSDDPNDPLNWPLWRRDLILFVLSVTAIFATALGPILAANTLTMSVWVYQRPFTQIALLTGWFLFGAGFATIFMVASAKVWGKRHLFLVGVVTVTISSAWAGASKDNYTSMVWARIFQGIGAAPFETLVNAVVGDMYFVHQRGKRMAVTNLAVFGGAFMTPILAGKITDSMGWEWTFYFEAIFCALCVPAVIFLVPETAFRRSAHLNTDLLSDDEQRFGSRTSESSQEQPMSAGASNSHEMGTMNDEKRGAASQPDSQDTLPIDSAENAQPKPQQQTSSKEFESSTPIPPKKTYLQTLKPFSGWYTNENYFKILIRPFPLFFQPAILWACLIQGCMIGWTVFIGIILAAIFLGPPLYWTEVETGYAYTGAFLGAIIGFVIAGTLADWSAKFMTRKNGGIYEPEFRIILVIPQLVLGCAGLYGFGMVSSELYRHHWVWPVFFFALEVAGMVVGAVASSLYVVDAHRDIAVEVFTCLIIFKNFFSFGLTFSAYDWIVKFGIYETFLVISSIQVFVCLLSIPMYIFGKRNRSFFHRHDIFKTLKLD